MHCHCYLRNGIVYIPTQGMMGKGFYRDIEPVAAVLVSNTQALREAFTETIARGNPKVDIPRYPKIPLPVVPKYAHVKSWGIFARGTSNWALEEQDGVFRIHGYRKDGAGWVPDPTNRESFPPGTVANQVIERIIAILQEAAARGRSPPT